MSKTKFVLTPNPTFKATVMIPVPGESAAPVEFTFKHKTRDQYNEYMASIEGKSYAEIVMDIASGWDLSDPFDKDSIEKMTQNYIGSGMVVFDTYVQELTAARTKN